MIGRCRSPDEGKRAACSRGAFVKHYRVNKLDRPNGEIVKRKDVLANDDKQALDTAAADADCPICDVWHAGEKIGSID